MARRARPGDTTPSLNSIRPRASPRRPARQFAAFRTRRGPSPTPQFRDFVAGMRNGGVRRPRACSPTGAISAAGAAISSAAARRGSSAVTNVSWFAAQPIARRAAAAATTDEWEYALADGGRGGRLWRKLARMVFRAQSKQLLAAVGAARPMAMEFTTWSGWSGNGRTIFLRRDRRPNSATRRARTKRNFAGGGASGVRDPADYPAFMRYALRASLKAAYIPGQSRLSMRGDE